MIRSNQNIKNLKSNCKLMFNDNKELDVNDSYVSMHSDFISKIIFNDSQMKFSNGIISFPEYDVEIGKIWIDIIYNKNNRPIFDQYIIFEFLSFMDKIQALKYLEFNETLTQIFINIECNNLNIRCDDNNKIKIIVHDISEYINDFYSFMKKYCILSLQQYLHIIS